jgi:AcrR family transcriptional regulator
MITVDGEMATPRASRGDATRSMELLWGIAAKPTRGPKQGLTVDRIVETAVAIADAEGIDAVAMRRLAATLEVGAMSLYTYVPGRSELVDLMLDHVYGEQLADMVARTGQGGGWRAGIEARARADWAMYERHPWVVRAAGPRPTLGPNELAVQEATYAAVDGIGLTGHEMGAVITLVAGYVGGVARGIAEVPAEGETHTSEDTWWAARSAMLDRVFVPERFPVTCRLAEEGTFDGDPDAADYLANEIRTTFEFGLERVLDGIGVLVAARTSSR